MSGAGDYSDSFEWQRATVTRSTANGGPNKYSYATAGYLWGRLDVTNGRSQEAYGATRTGADGTITLQGWLDIAPQDLFVYSTFGDTYRVETVRRDRTSYETICDCYKYDVNQ